jgi:hypothetical protein
MCPSVDAFVRDVKAALNACYDARPAVMHNYPVSDIVIPELSVRAQKMLTFQTISTIE